MQKAAEENFKAAAVLDARYGKEGTPQRIKFEEEGYAYCTGLILCDARKNANVSQAELAKRTQATKSTENYSHFAYFMLSAMLESNNWELVGNCSRIPNSRLYV